MIPGNSIKARRNLFKTTKDLRVRSLVIEKSDLLGHDEKETPSRNDATKLAPQKEALHDLNTRMTMKSFNLGYKLQREQLKKQIVSDIKSNLEAVKTIFVTQELFREFVESRLDKYELTFSEKGLKEVLEDEELYEEIKALFQHLTPKKKIIRRFRRKTIFSYQNSTVSSSFKKRHLSFIDDLQSPVNMSKKTIGFSGDGSNKSIDDKFFRISVTQDSENQSVDSSAGSSKVINVNHKRKKSTFCKGAESPKSNSFFLPPTVSSPNPKLGEKENSKLNKLLKGKVGKGEFLENLSIAKTPNKNPASFLVYYNNLKSPECKQNSPLLKKPKLKFSFRKSIMRGTIFSRQKRKL